MRYAQALVSLLFVPVAVLGAQQTGANKSADEPDSYAISMSSNLVVETITVHDKQGRSVQGLTGNNFVLQEDGISQSIRYCEYQNLAETAKPLDAIAPDAKLNLYKKLARTQIAPEGAGQNRYRNRRLLVLYFDLLSLQPFERAKAALAAMTFIRTKMTSVDMLAVMRFNGGSIDVLQDFTDDRIRLLSILQTLSIGEHEDLSDMDTHSSSDSAKTDFGQDDSEFNIFTTDRQLAAIQTAVQMLGTLRQKKTLLLFTAGLDLNGNSNQAQMHAAVDAAIRAGVTIWTIDVRGLVAAAPMGDASQASTGDQSMYTGQVAATLNDTLLRSQDALYEIAADSGGKAFENNNELTRGIVLAQESTSDYYVISYYTRNVELNGKYRRIHISLAGDSSAKLEYRQGYYAGKQFKKFTETDRERQLEDALMLGDPITELTIGLEVDYFQLNSAEYFVPITIKIPGRELVLAKHGGARSTRIDFIGEIRDMASGETVSNMRDHVHIKLNDATASELARRPIEYDTGYTILPGTYQIKFLARDDETGRIGTYQAEFVVPNLTREEKRIPISAVVLSSQRVDKQSILYDAENARDRVKADAMNPLAQDGRKIIPSVTRVFGLGHPLWVYLQAYKQQAVRKETGIGEPVQDTPLFAYVTLFHDGRKVLETQPLAARPDKKREIGSVPFTFNIDTGGLPAGQYECHLTVLDVAAEKSTYWEAPILLSGRVDPGLNNP